MSDEELVEEWENGIESNYLDDAADFFATKLIEEFDGVAVERLQVPTWRRGWTILTPPQFVDVALLKDRIVELRDILYFDKGVLIGYRIVKSPDE